MLHYFILLLNINQNFKVKVMDDRGGQEIAEYIEWRKNKAMFRSAFVNFDLAFLAYNNKNTLKVLFFKSPQDKKCCKSKTL